MGGSCHSTPSCPVCSPVGSSVLSFNQDFNSNFLFSSPMNTLRDHRSATPHGKESNPAIVMSLAISGFVRSSASKSMYRRALRALCGDPGTLFCMHKSALGSCYAAQSCTVGCSMTFVLQ